MAWPNPNEYAEAIQTPRQAFSNYELQSARVVTDKLGLPRPISGNFATVFEVENAGKKWAVRCFLREVTNQRQRYAAITQHLRQHNLACLVGFEYLPQGIKVKGKWYPILKMDWAAGSRLDIYLKANLQNPQKLQRLAEQWISLCLSLRQASLAHGDLQHGNILVMSQDEIKLIDYDGVFIPDIIRLPSNEIGHVHYQHPTRQSDDDVSGSNYQNIDNFSTHVIGLSLFALSIDPTLWQKTKAGEENLLFRVEDYKHPQSSDTLRMFQNHTDARIQGLAQQMRQIIASPSYLAVPPLEKLEIDSGVAAKDWLEPYLGGAKQPKPSTNAGRPSWLPAHIEAGSTRQPSAATRPQIKQRLQQRWAMLIQMLLRTLLVVVVSGSIVVAGAVGFLLFSTYQQSRADTIASQVVYANATATQVVYTNATATQQQVAYANATATQMVYANATVTQRQVWANANDTQVAYANATAIQRQAWANANDTQVAYANATAIQRQAWANATATAIAPDLVAARTPVAHNQQWTPVIQTFDGVEMVLVPAGCFMMGSKDGFSDEQPVHQQCFDVPFWMDRYEVTNAQFAQFNGQAGRASYWTDTNRPRETITWYEARDFCAKRGARLPTEAEWEYAARGPDTLVYPWGNNFVADNVVYERNSGGHTWDVGSKPGGASWVGALDMSGNIWEWVSSIYKDYPYDPQDGREDLQDTNRTRVLRGSSWVNNEFYVRGAPRLRFTPHDYYYILGLRCASAY